jgi:DNA primase
MRINPETVDRIKQTAAVADVIGDYVTVKKKGANYWACCPFHGEKTPSFSISPSKGIYKCFGCGKAGDSVRFIMDIEGLGYGEALRHLAKKYGIEIQEEEMTDDQMNRQNERESLFIILEYAKDFFKSQLLQSDEGKSIALPYFKERGFSDATIQTFDLGYSPESWDLFVKSAIKEGYSQEIIEKAGLVTQRNEEGKVYDRFRNRVIFPIHNVSGKVIAFGARILKSDASKSSQAKYLNSPETEVYHKSSILYGIAQAKNEIRNLDVCYLVEGYTDVISLHQAGIKNVVASSGTSLTTEQIKLIARFTKHVTVLYDGDQAGIKAALRGMDLILEEGLQVNLVVFPEGNDPDSFVRKIGSEAFLDYIKKEAKDVISFQANLFMKEAGDDPFKKSELIKEMVQSISKIPDAIQRSLFIQKTASLMRLEEDILISELNKIHLKSLKQKSPNQFSDSSKALSAQEYQELQGLFEPSDHESPPQVQNLSYYQESECIRLIMNFGHMEINAVAAPGLTLTQYMLDELEDTEFQSTIFHQIFTICKNEIDKKNPLTPDFFLHHPEEEIQKLAIDFSSEKHILSDVWKDKHDIRVSREEEMLEDLAYKNVLRLRKVYNDQKLNEVLNSLEKADVSPDALNELLVKFIELKEIQKNISQELGTVIEK